MGVDSQILGNNARGHRIEHDGLFFELKLIDQEAKAEWERRLYERAVRAAESLAKLRGDAWLENKLVDLENGFFAGEYAFLSEKSLKLLTTPGGVEMLLGILTGKELAELAPVIIAKEKEVKAKLHLIIRESFPGVKMTEPAEDASPN